jgi:hypothetical protein
MRHHSARCRGRDGFAVLAMTSSPVVIARSAATKQSRFMPRSRWRIGIRATLGPLNRSLSPPPGSGRDDTAIAPPVADAPGVVAAGGQRRWCRSGPVDVSLTAFPSSSMHSHLLCRLIADSGPGTNATTSSWGVRRRVTAISDRQCPAPVWGIAAIPPGRGRETRDSGPRPSREWHQKR